PSIVNIPINGFREIVCGGSHAFYIYDDGTVKCVGYNYYGQLCTGDKSSKLTITDVPIGRVRQIRLGNYFTIFISLEDNYIRSCGHNYYDQLGDYNGVDSYNPITLDIDLKYSSFLNFFITSEDGKLIGVLKKMPNCICVIDPIKLTDASDYIWSGLSNKIKSLTLLDRDNVLAVDETGKYSIINLTTGTYSYVVKISSGKNHTLFLFNDGTVKGCGSNSFGQLGLGSSVTLATNLTDIPINNVKDITCGSDFTIFLMNDGTVRGCGYNYNGQLGLGNSTDQFSIVNIPISNV
ncbi:hypothetical protein, partial [Brevibacillus sp. MCWH]|uniref:RCC1 domain-containing protein n=1 Tax=Brevibacillus sp. MCWH TaxID=2508871 RepID=UPI001C0F30DD